MSRNHSKKNRCCHRAKQCCVAVPPWSETNWEPDTQWCPTVPIKTPLKTVQTPFYTSSEDPAPQWVANVIIKPPCDCKAIGHHKSKHSHRKNCWGGCEFLRSHWRDNIERHVYGTNPFSDTVNSGGSHFQ